MQNFERFRTLYKANFAKKKEFQTSILHMGVINVLKLSSNIDNVLSLYIVPTIVKKSVRNKLSFQV